MKKLIIIVLVLIAIGGVAGYFMYNKPHQSTAAAPSDFVVSAQTLFQEFNTDEAAANTKYLDKVVKVKGTVKAVETDEAGNVTMTLDAANEMFGVICTIPNDNAAQLPEVGEEVTVKGVCTGKLMDVVLIRCVLVD